jgi:RNA polymerase sigma-70 factor (ECF subfamily)
MPADDDVTALLLAWREGEAGALDRLFPLVYAELRRIARRQLARERAGHTLDTIALVNEAYLKLVDQPRVHWQDRAHFLRVAAWAMRQVLVDHARRHQAMRRGGDLDRVPLDEEVALAEREDRLLALDDALEGLAAVDERLSRVVECRYFGGLTEAETAEALGVTSRTVRRDWVKARKWLSLELRH